KDEGQADATDNNNCDEDSIHSKFFSHLSKVCFQVKCSQPAVVMDDRLNNHRGAILKGATGLLRAQRRCFRGCNPGRVTGKKASLLVVETSRFDMGVFAKSGKKFGAI